MLHVLIVWERKLGLESMKLYGPYLSAEDAELQFLGLDARRYDHEVRPLHEGIVPVGE